MIALALLNLPLDAVLIPILLIAVALAIISIAGHWRIFTKAGQPGWAALIPVYHYYVMLKVAGKPGWWLLLFLVPLVNLVVIVLMLVGLAKNFGRDAGFAIGLVLFPYIFFPVLGFGSAQYIGHAPPMPAKI